MKVFLMPKDMSYNMLPVINTSPMDPMGIFIPRKTRPTEFEMFIPC